ncbi:hypothetical protein H4684_002867 [Desulfomicrobium macestii]|uniref:HAMP domain-containing protein n=1 Tax=Desulfomicrobium macestii TaxID=90731 RepID=A0ABR9H662_9BACT|nr:hypothetical protein [Desulfomicrobium macestii]MBE1426203.1 hypothetical protein [Desulfomicrobium macestii]
MNSTLEQTCDTNCRCLVKRILRRQLFIDKKFQLTMAGNMLLMALVCMLVTAMATSWFYIYFLNDRLWADTDSMFWTKAGIIAAFMLAGVVIWTVARTHSIAGPVCKIRRTLQDAAQGNFPAQPVRFRKGDAFQELAEDVNRCLDIMKQNSARRD